MCWPTLSAGERAAVRVVADANVLLSAILGGRARLILESSQIDEILTTESILGEVREYTVVLAKKKNLPEDILLLAVASLPVTVVEQAAYEGSLSEAKRRIGRRDPDDVQILALAIQMKLPLWSNDNDFEDAGIQWFTTKDLFRELGLLRES
jgi:predicted nucleic acid-binding protein